MITAQRSISSRAVAAARNIGLVTMTAFLAACSQGGSLDQLASLGLSEQAEKPKSRGSRNDLDAAIGYWGKEFLKKPGNKKAGLAYAKNLKAAGHKKQALAVLRQVALRHGDDREVAAEYGRLALANGQVDLAHKLLAHADDPSQPDWRIVSGRGTALAQRGKFPEAIAQFQRALRLAPANPTVMSNLAMAEAASGNLGRAETLLRQAASMPMAKPKVRQNLALVLKLQGREAESAQVAANAGSAIRPSVQPVTLPNYSNRVAQR